MALAAKNISKPIPASESVGSCLLCGATNGRVIVQDNGYVGRACDCGTVYIDPWPREEQLAPTHDFHVDTYYSYPAKVRFQFLDRMCNAMLPTGPRKVLEVGSGPGYTLKLARDAGYEVHSIEPNSHSADQIEALGIPNERAMVEQSELPSSQFDAVFHVDLLSHFADPVIALKSMSRLLKPDGFLCFEVGLFGGLSDRWYRWIGQVGYPQHPWLYSEDALASLFDKAGLELVYKQRFNLFPGTMLSTIGTSLFRRVFPKPKSRTGRPAKPNLIYRMYGHLQFNLRYRIGRMVPSLGGPACCFMAVKPKQSSLRIFEGPEA